MNKNLKPRKVDFSELTRILEKYERKFGYSTEYEKNPDDSLSWIISSDKASVTRSRKNGEELNQKGYDPLRRATLFVLLSLGISVAVWYSLPTSLKKYLLSFFEEPNSKIGKEMEPFEGESGEKGSDSQTKSGEEKDSEENQNSEVPNKTLADELFQLEEVVELQLNDLLQFPSHKQINEVIDYGGGYNVVFVLNDTLIPAVVLREEAINLMNSGARCFRINGLKTGTEKDQARVRRTGEVLTNFIEKGYKLSLGSLVSNTYVDVYALLLTFEDWVNNSVLEKIVLPGGSTIFDNRVFSVVQRVDANNVTYLGYYFPSGTGSFIRLLSKINALGAVGQKIELLMLANNPEDKENLNHSNFF